MIYLESEEPAAPRVSMENGNPFGLAFTITDKFQ
jgi:hypothetical protein